MSYTIRLAQARHITQIAEITNLEASRSVATVASSHEPIDRWLTQYQQSHHLTPWLVAIESPSEFQSSTGEDRDQVIGYAKASPYNVRDGFTWSVALSIYIAESHKRMGVGEALYKILFELLIRQGYLNVYARIALPNPGSQRLHERYGLQQTGVLPQFAWKFGAWHDMAIYTGALQEKPDGTPRPLRRVEEIWPQLSLEWGLDL